IYRLFSEVAPHGPGWVRLERPLHLQDFFSYGRRDQVEPWIKDIEGQESIVFQMQGCCFKRVNLVIQSMHVLQGPEWDGYQRVFPAQPKSSHVTTGKGDPVAYLVR